VENQVLTIKQVAEYLQVTEKTIYTLVQEGNIPAFKVRGQWRFKREDIERWIEENKENSKKERADKENNRKGYGHYS
jgi:excisionase family DNA binding protein